MAEESFPHDCATKVSKELLVHLGAWNIRFSLLTRANMWFLLTAAPSPWSFLPGFVMLASAAPAQCLHCTSFQRRASLSPTPAVHPALQGTALRRSFASVRWEQRTPEVSGVARWWIRTLPPVCGPQGSLRTRIKGLVGWPWVHRAHRSRRSGSPCPSPSGLPGHGGGWELTPLLNASSRQKFHFAFAQGSGAQPLLSKEVTAQALRGKSGCQWNGRGVTVLTQIRQNLTLINPSEQGLWFVLFSIYSVFKASTFFLSLYRYC